MSSTIGSGSTMASTQVNVMKKANDIAARSILSVLESSSQQTQQQSSSAVAGIGKNIDIKA
ncbi:hypothetical protein [Sulfurimonas sp. C5]|uniref:hypothetical protein n=1 Tax=Sulfurimonas sp. C5 TaxID=3036947 RepID=UPI0024580E41|nr:hypothetical protein [Sulfurimonas sp. C5]MDH4943912.1 hypothetical protein [Sulfurimonas sp. C5]